MRQKNKKELQFRVAALVKLKIRIFVGTTNRGKNVDLRNTKYSVE